VKVKMSIPIPRGSVKLQHALGAALLRNVSVSVHVGVTVLHAGGEALNRAEQSIPGGDPDIGAVPTRLWARTGKRLHAAPDSSICRAA
jgi:hypothetical protein